MIFFSNVHKSPLNGTYMKIINIDTHDLNERTFILLIINLFILFLNINIHNRVNTMLSIAPFQTNPIINIIYLAPYTGGHQKVYRTEYKGNNVRGQN